MIQLPDNWLDTVRVIPGDKVLLIAMKNDADQYFVERMILDPAFPLSQGLELLDKADRSQALAFKYGEGMVMVSIEPSDQNWVPFPIVGSDVISLAQYKAMMGLKDA